MPSRESLAVRAIATQELYSLPCAGRHQPTDGAYFNVGNSTIGAWIQHSLFLGSTMQGLTTNDFSALKLEMLAVMNIVVWLFMDRCGICLSREAVI
ncbi:hypothetical protein GCM10009332_11560 [Shewanella gelidii]|uniref:Uncharacterized protein n=1 Tax=Shewanella gelidii TaxID=1642821 RepID=A0A917JNS5_9GAMM|nr:hypothetical protein GCM10009332_11560 [Shewanella gelidii]